MPTLHARLHQLPPTPQSPIPGEIETETGLGDEMEEILNSRTDPWDPWQRVPCNSKQMKLLIYYGNYIFSASKLSAAIEIAELFPLLGSRAGLRRDEILHGSVQQSPEDEGGRIAFEERLTAAQSVRAAPG